MDADDEYQGAVPLSRGLNSGTLDENDTQDYWTIALSKGDTITIHIEYDSTLDILVDLLWPSLDYGDGRNKIIIDREATASGDYFVLVRHVSGVGSYSLDVSVKGPGLSLGTLSNLLLPLVLIIGPLGTIVGTALYYISSKKQERKTRSITTLTEELSSPKPIVTKKVSPTRITFFCQIDDQTHPMTDSAYQCQSCNRFVCGDCYSTKLIQIGVTVCPFCQGSMQKIQ